MMSRMPQLVRALGACAFLFTTFGAAPTLAAGLSLYVPNEVRAEIAPLERAPLRAARDEVYLAQVAHKDAQAQAARAEGVLDAAQGRLEMLEDEGAHPADLRMARGYVQLAEERLTLALAEKARLGAAVQVREAELELAWVQLLKMRGTPHAEDLSRHDYEAQLARAEITFDRLSRRADRAARRAPAKIDIGVAAR